MQLFDIALAAAVLFFDGEAAIGCRDVGFWGARTLRVWCEIGP
jgi:hypothetical protein